jgi:hypothetical protein
LSRFKGSVSCYIVTADSGRRFIILILFLWLFFMLGFGRAFCKGLEGDLIIFRLNDYFMLLKAIPLAHGVAAHLTNTNINLNRIE